MTSPNRSNECGGIPPRLIGLGLEAGSQQPTTPAPTMPSNIIHLVHSTNRVILNINDTDVHAPYHAAKGMTRDGFIVDPGAASGVVADKICGI